MKPPRPPRGFTLVELAIVIAISGLLMAGIARFFETFEMQQALKITRQRIEKIQNQLDAFADRNERLPCPVPPASGASAAEPNSCSTPDLPPDERDVAMGALPAATLGLTPEEARDGWGNMFTYAVSAILTKPKMMGGVNLLLGVIGMIDGYGENVLQRPDSGRYAIVSHGPTGAGGFTAEGKQIPCHEGTLAGKNCIPHGVFVTTAWSLAPGPFFFDNIVAGDGARRQAQLLAHIAFCEALGKYYAPEHYVSDANGCVGDDKIHGACTVKSSYMDHGGDDPFTGNWDEPPQVEWPPAKAQPRATVCECEKNFRLLPTGTWELPLHHPQPPLTLKQNCELAAAHEKSAVIHDLCGEDPPSVDIREAEWDYEWVTTMEGKIWQLKGSVWKPDGYGSQIMPMLARDPDTGKIVHVKAAAHQPDRFPTRVRHIVFSMPLVEQNHKLTLYTCMRK